jgi:hypothetical protein
MRYLVIAAIFCLTHVSCYYENEKPELLVLNNIIDLARIKYDSNYTLRYSLLNNGSKVLIIDTASSSCGCTVPFISKKEIQPGDSAILTVSYKPADTGYFNKKVVIKSNIDSVFTIVSFIGKAVK